MLNIMITAFEVIMSSFIYLTYFIYLKYSAGGNRSTVKFGQFFGYVSFLCFYFFFMSMLQLAKNIFYILKWLYSQWLNMGTENFKYLRFEDFKTLKEFCGLLNWMKFLLSILTVYIVCPVS
jgi:hypothetical protein